MRIGLIRGTVVLALTAVVAGSAGYPDESSISPAAALTNRFPTPFPRPYSPDIEAYAAYDGQTVCGKSAKAGVVAFERLVLRRFARTSFGIWRSCAGSSISEHKEGRAIDWHMSAYNSTDRAAVQRLTRMLFATDWWGNTHSMARRLGIMYIIWNKHMWRAYRPFDGWQKYTGSNPHTDHVHISFARAGGLAKTSYWTGTVADLPAAWVPDWPPTPTPTPTLSPSPTLTPLPS